MTTSLQAVNSFPFLRLGLDAALRKVLGQGILLLLLYMLFVLLGLWDPKQGLGSH